MYPLSVYDSAAENLHKIGINVITHIILGLPNESKEMMLESVKYAGSKTDGIKLQLLHILKNTDLCDDYESGNLTFRELCAFAPIVNVFRFSPPHTLNLSAFYNRSQQIVGIRTAKTARYSTAIAQCITNAETYH